MKKKLALILSLCMLCGTSATAATINTNTTEQSADVTYSVDSSYTVTIPESVTIDSTSRTGTGEVTIFANPILPAETQYLWVGVGQGSYWSGSSLRMVLTDVEKNTINRNYMLEYGITMAGDNTTVYPNNEKNTPFLQLQSGSKKGKMTTLTFALSESESVKAAGTYKDVLTFWVKLSNSQSKYAN